MRTGKKPRYLDLDYLTRQRFLQRAGRIFPFVMIAIAATFNYWGHPIITVLMMVTVQLVVFMVLPMLWRWHHPQR
ncbi:hypothetical protein R84981_001019 [Carnimonas sp. R-84981]|uniref:hypothetical protein n=1 Tax=Carnimonas bestiolae TaxID=3402172 RepID=UPI003EDC9517